MGRRWAGGERTSDGGQEWMDAACSQVEEKASINPFMPVASNNRLTALMLSL